jgi:excisionase family DNA binding protein
VTRRVKGANYAHQNDGNAMQAQYDEVLSIDELATYLKVSKSTLYKLVQEGKVLGQKVGKHWSFKRDVIDRWLEPTGQTKLKKTKPK